MREIREITEMLENAKIANRQGEFLEKLTVISESTMAGVIVAMEDPIEVEKWLNDTEKG